MLNTTLPGLDGGVRTQIVRVTPETAAAWLARTVANRTISKLAVDQYASDMAHDWPFTGQPIVFDSNGHLSDGQHRLTAQVKAGVVIEWLVVTGVEPSAQDYIDIGRPRTVANQLQIKGVTFSNAIAAVSRMLLVYGGERNPSKPMIREYAEKEAEALREAGHVGRSVAQVIRGSSAAYGAAYLTLSRLDSDAASDFFDSLQTGADLSLTSPILIARTYIARTQQNARSMDDSARVAFINYLYKTWNLWRENKRVKSFSRPTTTVVPK